MTKYACHETKGVIILDSNPLSMAAWLEWKDSTGFDGDSSECWPCYCERTKEGGRGSNTVTGSASAKPKTDGGTR